MAARLAAGEDVYGIVHWGLNTYTDSEWGRGDADPALLAPSSFDADQIVGACRDGGLCGLVVVAKHHDGFCLWPTRTTDYNISRTPFWESRKTEVQCRMSKGDHRTNGRDYVGEMADACRRAGLKFGVYCSPWDRHDANYATARYVETYHAQLRELLDGRYGDIFEMWFDGANGGDGYYGGARETRRIGSDYYRFKEVFGFVRRLQPGVTIFAGESDDSDLRWPGNERGFLDPDSRATVVATGGFRDGMFGNPGYVPQRNVGTPDGDFFRVAEADFPLRRGWFWHEGENGTTKSGESLARTYLDTVGNGGTMNIGVAPNKDGLLDAEDAAALRGFRFLRNALFAEEVAAGGLGASAHVPEGGFNVVALREDVSRGERVDGWEFLADGKPILRGASIGVRRLRVLPQPCQARACELRITKSAGGADVSFSLFRADAQLVRRILTAAADHDETDTAKWMEGAAAKPTETGR